jgi:hypothetical protein
MCKIVGVGISINSLIRGNIVGILWELELELGMLLELELGILWEYCGNWNWN